MIWRATGGNGFLSSHRLISVMHHRGEGVLGPATSRTVRARIIADCLVRDGVVIEEWLARDQAAFAHCLGMTARELAQAQIARGDAGFFTPADDREGDYEPVIEDDPDLVAVIALLARIWDAKDTSTVRQLYFHGAALHAPGGASRHGWTDIDQWIVGYLASFPNARWRVHSAHINRDPGLPLRVALRWSFDGAHSGWGHFGQPSGRPVHVMGFTHLDLAAGCVRADWTVTDEVAIWKQILA